MGHFDGTRLVVQYSPDMDFSTRNKQDLDTVLQWMLSTPCGDTTCIALAAELNKVPATPVFEQQIDPDKAIHKQMMPWIDERF
jgi:hypothetical protein